MHFWWVFQCWLKLNIFYMKPVPHVQFIKSKGNTACKTTWFRGKLACDGLDTFSDFWSTYHGMSFLLLVKQKLEEVSALIVQRKGEVTRSRKKFPRSSLQLVLARICHNFACHHFTWNRPKNDDFYTMV